MTIKTLIWDLGGVLVRTEDREPRDKLAARLGMDRWELSSLFFGHHNGHDAQTGEMSLDSHWEKVSKALNVEVEEIPALRREFFEGDVLDEDLVDYVRGLKSKYQTALLSNALANLRTLIFEDWEIDDAFDDIIISAEVGMVKPGKQIFRLALQRLGVEPTEAVFIDDWIKNIEAAQAVGLHTVHFQDPRQTRQELDALLKSNT